MDQSDERIDIWKRYSTQRKIDHNRLHLKYNIEHFAAMF